MRQCAYVAIIIRIATVTIKQARAFVILTHIHIVLITVPTLPSQNLIDKLMKGILKLELPCVWVCRVLAANQVQQMSCHGTFDATKPFCRRNMMQHMVSDMYIGSNMANPLTKQLFHAADVFLSCQFILWDFADIPARIS
jgi:hypothetical protein